jgi:hypothetical protein
MNHEMLSRLHSEPKSTPLYLHTLSVDQAGETKDQVGLPPGKSHRSLTSPPENAENHITGDRGDIPSGILPMHCNPRPPGALPVLEGLNKVGALI